MLNKFLVGVQGDQVVIGLVWQVAMMTKADALNLAAWLVALAADAPESPDGDFPPLLREVLDT